MFHSSPFPGVSFLHGEEVHTELHKPQRGWVGEGTGAEEAAGPGESFQMSETHVISTTEGWRDPGMG